MRSVFFVFMIVILVVVANLAFGAGGYTTGGPYFHNSISLPGFTG
jgi:hypothetical protein